MRKRLIIFRNSMNFCTLFNCLTTLLRCLNYFTR